jgi:hypothetical protein
MFKSWLSNNRSFMHIKRFRELLQALYCSWTLLPPPTTALINILVLLFSHRKVPHAYSTALQISSTVKFRGPDGVGCQWRQREDKSLIRIHGTTLSLSTYTTNCTIDTLAILIHNFSPQSHGPNATCQLLVSALHTTSSDLCNRSCSTLH